ncbi:MAG: hypothetical protein Q4A41_01220, partial [Bacillota bacterium]|nr:hypothetical protein [Bacillota bacterium]
MFKLRLDQMASIALSGLGAAILTILAGWAISALILFLSPDISFSPSFLKWMGLLVAVVGVTMLFLKIFQKISRFVRTISSRRFSKKESERVFFLSGISHWKQNPHSFLIHDLPGYEKKFLQAKECMFESLFAFPVVFIVLCVIDVNYLWFLGSFFICAVILPFWYSKKQEYLEYYFPEKKGDMARPPSNYLYSVVLSRLNPTWRRYVEKMSKVFKKDEKSVQAHQFHTQEQTELMRHLVLTYIFFVLIYLGFNLALKTIPWKDAVSGYLMSCYAFSLLKNLMHAPTHMLSLRKVVKEQFDILFRSAEKSATRKTAPHPFQDRLTAKNLIVRVDDCRVVQYPDFEIRKGSKVLMKYCSDHSKTLLSAILRGEIVDYAGDLQIDGVSIRGKNQDLTASGLKIFCPGAPVAESVWRETVAESQKTGATVIVLFPHGAECETASASQDMSQVAAQHVSSHTAPHAAPH